ncbi:MAG: hypothetical protein QOE62_3174 [Actinomycetota bacterium]|nr:hypothetical protein [Actinomycetota bacterium]
MPRRAIRFGGAIVIVAATFVGFGAPVAGAVTGSIACGAEIVTSVRLHHDLVGCRGDGLVVGAPGITIDLNGHTISGTNAPGSEGIADDGYGHVIVEHGKIRAFFVNGVGLRQAPASLVRGLTIRAIGAGGVDGQFSTGIAVDNSPATRISGNDISNDVVAFEADGIVVKASPGTRIDHNRLNRNSWDGLFVFASPQSRVDRNVADANPNNGMAVNGSSDLTRLTGNDTSRNGNVGIAAGAMRRAVIDWNTADRNGFGMNAEDTGLFFFDLHDSEIDHNTASRNIVGIDLFGGLHGSTGNHVVGNVANDNQIIGVVIDVGDGGTLTNGANGNTVIGNVADRNRGSVADDGGGIGVFGTGNRLRRNHANGNTANGLLVRTAGNTLTLNVANENAAHGIDAVTGTTDGGGNRAHRNQPPQCLGVACRG